MEEVRLDQQCAQIARLLGQCAVGFAMSLVVLIEHGVGIGKRQMRGRVIQMGSDHRVQCRQCCRTVAPTQGFNSGLGQCPGLRGLHAKLLLAQ